MNVSSKSPPDGTVRDWLAARARLGGTAFVFPETGASLDWHDLEHEALATARHPTALGVAKGESVAIVAPNNREGLIALFALLVGGFRATLINLAAGQDAIAYALDHSEADIAAHITFRQDSARRRAGHRNTPKKAT